MFIERDLRELSNVSNIHFPDRSMKWLLRQREHLQALLRMFGSEIADALDFEHVEQLNRSFISDELRTQESDMVFRVPFRSPTQTGQEVIVYLLIEHQSTVDASMGLRLLSYMTQIWMEERREWQEKKRPRGEWRLTPILPIVFYTGHGEWKATLSLTALMNTPEILTRFVPTFDTLLLDVKATAPDELTQTGHALGWLLTVLQHEQSEAPIMRQALLDALEGLRDLQTHDAAQYTRAILYLFLLILHRRDAAEHQNLLRILTQENTQNQEIVNMAASIIEISEQRGLQQGIEQGIEQGEIRGKQEAILKLLHHRFQSVPDVVLMRVRALQSLVELDVLFEKSLTAESLEDLQESSRKERITRTE